MKIGLLLAGLCFTGYAVAGTAEQQPDPVTESANVKIEWQSPETFRDVRSATENNKTYRKRVFEQLTKALGKDASRLLKKGEKLELVVTDLDLAGDLRPTFGATAGSELRVVKDIYPPRITFTYRVLDGEQVIMVGSEKLRDPGFMDRSYVNDTDALRYEKEMLESWLRKTVVPKA